jgi:hypothetical protein
MRVSNDTLISFSLPEALLSCSAKKVTKECGIGEALRSCSRKISVFTRQNNRTIPSGEGQKQKVLHLARLALPYIPLPQRFFDSSSNIPVQ